MARPLFRRQSFSATRLRRSCDATKDGGLVRSLQSTTFMRQCRSISICHYPSRIMSHEDKNAKHTTGGIPRWSPTLVLVARFSAYVWQSGRDAQFSLTYGRMY